jgi:hypothetical protein
LSDLLTACRFNLDRPHDGNTDRVEHTHSQSQ